MDFDSVGTLLYWCERSKRERERRVEFVDSDSDMILFMRHIRAKGVDESRLRVRMVIHLQDDEEKCKKLWKMVTGLDDDNFLPTILKRTS